MEGRREERKGKERKGMERYGYKVRIQRKVSRSSLLLGWWWMKGVIFLVKLNLLVEYVCLFVN